MEFGGFQPFTLSDFPGRVAAIAFTQGCNFRCPFCHNGELIPGEAAVRSIVSEAYVFQFLEARRGRLEGLVVSGGEPTIHPDLPEFLRRVKAMGLQTKLDTNGSRPEMLADVMAEGLVDYIAMDIKAPFGCYERLAGRPVSTRDLEASIAAIAVSGIAHEFRTTVVDSLLSDADIEAIRAVVPRGSRHRLQPFRPEHALDHRLRKSQPRRARKRVRKRVRDTVDVA